MTRLIALMTLAAALLFAPAAQAQDFSYRDGTIAFDKKGYKTEFDQMQRSLGKATPRRRTYCITCADGTKLGCRAVVGGSVGRGICLLGGAASCNPPGVSTVTNGSCSAGPAT